MRNLGFLRYMRTFLCYLWQLKKAAKYFRSHREDRIHFYLPKLVGDDCQSFPIIWEFRTFRPRSSGIFTVQSVIVPDLQGLWRSTWVSQDRIFIKMITRFLPLSLLLLLLLLLWWLLLLLWLLFLLSNFDLPLVIALANKILQNYMMIK